MCGHRCPYIGCFTTNVSLRRIRFQSQNFPLYKHLFILHGRKSQRRANMSRRVWFARCAAKWNSNCCCQMELEVIMCVLIVTVMQGGRKSQCFFHMAAGHVVVLVNRLNKCVSQVVISCLFSLQMRLNHKRWGDWYTTWVTYSACPVENYISLSYTLPFGIKFGIIKFF